jgi:hypothetical protein
MRGFRAEVMEGVVRINAQLDRMDAEQQAVTAMMDDRLPARARSLSATKQGSVLQIIAAYEER